jgi:RNase adaptor protein for sRNA GlmZ degradation
VVSAVAVISFGYLPGVPPSADMTFDLRRHFRDPHWDENPALRELTGLDDAVAARVLATPGILVLATAIAMAVAAYAEGPHGLPVIVAVGCAGGRHRSVAVAEAVASRLTAAGHDVTVRHRDIARPVVRRDAAAGQ